MINPKYFGTDGVRGQVGQFPMTIDFLLRLGWAAGKYINEKGAYGKVLIGKDTRVSGYMIESALEAGFCSRGIDVYRLGVLPTSGIAYLTRTLRADLGIVISASHNPFQDNGIKFFTTDGYKLSTEQEVAIEHNIEMPMDMAFSEHVGKVRAMHDAQGRYIEYCKSSIPHKTNLKGLKIVLDCANGAAYHIAPFVLGELGAEVISLHIKPNGMNINKNCGACHPEELVKRVLHEKADLGIALDGDGDRVLMVDHMGEILDGDELLFIILKGLIVAKRFEGGVVGTQMSNLGLEIAVKNLGIHFVRTAVGDQHIIHELLNKKWVLGGESSGHIVYFTVTTTGDGIIAALQVLQTMFASGESLYQLKQAMKKFPQKLINLPYKKKPISLEDESISKIVKKAEDQLKNHGRVLLRYSGTEPLLRIMVEGEDGQLVNQVAEEMEHAISKILR